MFLVQLQDVLQKQLSGKFTKQVYDMQVLEGTGQAQGHTVRSRIERRRLGALPIWGSVVGCLRFHSSLVNLKQEHGNYGPGREKQGHSSGQLLRSPKTFQKGTLMHGAAWLLI